MALNLATQSFLEYKLSERQTHYDKVTLYREYAEGDQAVHLTDDQKVLIVGEDSAGNPASNPEFMLNVCSSILDAETDRLEVQSITVTAPDDGGLTDQLSALAWEWWKASRLDEGQQNAHYAACRDADSYAFAYYDNKHMRPSVAINAAYNGKDAGADMFYIDDDPNHPEAAIKVWIVAEKAGVKIMRKNIYYEDRVEMWINDAGIAGSMFNAGWRPLRFTDEDWTPDIKEIPARQDTSLSTMATGVWWTDTGTERGQPLGIPIHHFRHQARGASYGRSTIADIVPGLQDAINRAGVSLMAAAQLNGFKSIWATGLDPDVNRIEMYPSSITYAQDKDAAFGQFTESDLMQLIEVKNTYIKDAATLTGTPLSFFNLGGQAPAEGSQKALEASLLAKTRRNQTAFGNTWEDVIRYMIKLESVQRGGQLNLTFEQIEDLQIDIVWEPAEMRNELTEIQVAQAHKDLGVPMKYVWRKLGYTEEDIDEFEQEADIKRQQAMAALTKKVQELEAQNEQPQEEAIDNGAELPANRIGVGTSGGNGTQPAGA